MSGLNYLKLGSTLSNVCNTTQLDDATKCHYALKNFWGEPCWGYTGIRLSFCVSICLSVYKILVSATALGEGEGFTKSH